MRREDVLAVAQGRRRLATHFRAHEFDCRCGCGLGLADMQPELLDALLRARALAQVPMVLTSAIRCPNHNAAVGGEPSSSHLSGWAVDIAIPHSPACYAIVTGLLGAGFDRLGLGPEFVHADRDPAKPAGVIWIY